MGTLIRQGHFLGTKLRSLRKRNGLTLDELSARCVQIDAAGAPSVSYLSMVETGKRMPLVRSAGYVGGVFSKDARWFLDENTEVEATPAQRARGGLEAMPLEPAFLFSHELLQNALPELLSQTGTTGPAICATADPRLAGDPPQQFSRHRACGRRLRQAPDAAHAGCGDGHLQTARAASANGSTATAASPAAPW